MRGSADVPTYVLHTPAKLNDIVGRKISRGGKNNSRSHRRRPSSSFGKIRVSKHMHFIYFVHECETNSMKVLASTCFLLLRSSQAFSKPSFLTSSSRSYSSTALKMSKPFSVIVEAEIQPDRMDEFLKMIEHNAINSRKEPGCLRFGKSSHQTRCMNSLCIIMR
jgi:hypothetical protein